MIWLLVPSPLPVPQVPRNHMVYCGLLANGRTASHWLLGREANLKRHGRMYCGWFVCGSNDKGGRRSSGRAAELKITKYSSFEDKCIFQPTAVESLGPLNETACQFLKDLGRRISAQSGDKRERESAFLFQRLSVVIQRFNAILLHGSFEAADHLG